MTWRRGFVHPWIGATIFPSILYVTVCYNNSNSGVRPPSLFQWTGQETHTLLTESPSKCSFLPCSKLLWLYKWKGKGRPVKFQRIPKWEAEVQLYPRLTSGIDVYELTQRAGRLTPREQNQYPRTRGRVDPGAGLDGLEWKSLVPTGVRTPNRPFRGEWL